MVKAHFLCIFHIQKCFFFNTIYQTQLDFWTLQHTLEPDASNSKC